MKRFQIIFMVLQVPLDALMLILAVVSAYLLRFTHIAVALKQPLFDLTLIDFVGIALLVIPVWLVIFAMTGLYSLDPNRKFSSVIIRILLGCSTGIAVLAMYILFTQQLFDSRFLVAASWVFAVFYVGLGRLFIRALQGILYRVGVGLRRVVIIGKDDIAKNLIETLSQRKELGYVVIASYKNFDKVVAKRMQKNIRTTWIKR